MENAICLCELKPAGRKYWEVLFIWQTSWSFDTFQILKRSNIIWLFWSFETFDDWKCFDIREVDGVSWWYLSCFIMSDHARLFNMRRLLLLNLWTEFADEYTSKVMLEFSMIYEPEKILSFMIYAELYKCLALLTSIHYLQLFGFSTFQMKQRIWGPEVDGVNLAVIWEDISYSSNGA